MPNEFRDLALAVCAQHSNIHRADELKPATKLKVLGLLDVWRKPERLEQVLLCCEADHRGRLGLESEPYPQREIFLRAYHAALGVEVQAVIADGFQGKHIKEELDKRRVSAIEAL